MDYRWSPVSRDSFRDMRVILHPTAAMWEVRRGMDPGSDDSVDLSEFVTQGTHTAFDANITLSFNRELFGDTQPKPNQILEIQFWQNNEWKPIWMGIIDAISQFTLQRGTRSMQLIAKTRDSQDIWRNVKRITPLFPQLTDLSYMIMRVARQAGMKGDEILLPPSAFTTAHSNTQMADMNAWDMVTSVAQALGWTPFIDGMGRLRMASRDLQGRRPEVVLSDERLIKVGGQRQRPPKSRVRVLWLNPTLKKYKKQDQLLGTPLVITMGWFLPYWKHTHWYSDDHTLRAENTRINWKDSKSVNQFAWQKLVKETWTPQAENRGKLSLLNIPTFAAVALLTFYLLSQKSRSDGVVGTAAVSTAPGVAPVTGHTVPSPTGAIKEAITFSAWAYMVMSIGTGTYHIWGTPFDWVHARNVSVAFDSSVPDWVDNSVDIESDFIINEEHAKAVAIRELIYQAREANKWNITIVDDPRIEYGDVLQFTDGTQLYVEDFTRNVERGSEATLDVRGFLIPITHPVAQGVIGGELPGDGGGGILPGEGEGPLGVPAIGKPCWLGWFEFINTLAYVPPSNCNMWVHINGEIQTPDARQFAQWVQGGTVEEIEAQVAASSEPCVAYWDSRTWPRYPALRGQDWLALQAYCLAGENPTTFETNMRATIGAVPGTQRICLVCQCYTSNTTLTADLAPLVAVYARLARDHANINMLLVFSDQGRATGLNDHQPVKPYWEELFAGITGAPDGSGGGGGGTGGGFGPNEMPSMQGTVNQVAGEQAPNGTAWDLSEANEDAPNGRGVFTGICVDRMHAADARFGHFHKTAGHNQYEGHAVDAVCFKNDDGLSQEGADIVTGSGGPTWGPYDRSARIPDGDYNCWIYPA
jgi:hypothetical protein